MIMNGSDRVVLGTVLVTVCATVLWGFAAGGLVLGACLFIYGKGEP